MWHSCKMGWIIMIFFFLLLFSLTQDSIMDFKPSKFLSLHIEKLSYHISSLPYVNIWVDGATLSICRDERFDTDKIFSMNFLFLIDLKSINMPIFHFCIYLKKKLPVFLFATFEAGVLHWSHAIHSWLSLLLTVAYLVESLDDIMCIYIGFVCGIHNNILKNACMCCLYYSTVFKIYFENWFGKKASLLEAKFNVSQSASHH